MKKQKFFSLWIILLLVGGCGPVFTLFPLFTGKDLVFDSELVGTWVNVEDVAVLSIQRAKEKAYKVRFTSSDFILGLQEGSLGRLGEFLYLDLYPDEDALLESFKEEIFFVIPTHFLIRLQREGDVLLVTYLDDDALMNRIERGEVTIAYRKIDDGYILTAPTSDLQALVLKYADDPEVIETFGTFHRRPAEVGHYYQGEAYRKRRLYAAAIAFYKKALVLKKDYAEVHKGLGDVYREQALRDQAIAAYKRALEINPAYGEAHRDLGRTYVKAELQAEALASFGKAVELRAESVGSGFYGDLTMEFLSVGEYELARKELSLVSQSRKDWANTVDAFVYFLEGEYGAAVERFGKDTSHSWRPWLNLSLKHLGKNDEAQKLLQAYVKDAERYDRRRDLALGRYHLGVLTEADLLSTAETAPERCRAYFHVGYQYLLRDEKKKARGYFKKAVETRASGKLEYIAARARLEQLGSD